MDKKHLRGYVGEFVAIAVLMVKGYRVVSWRRRYSGVEFDILCKKGASLIAVEVKYRQSLEGCHLSYAPNQQNRQLRALQHLCQEVGAGSARVDVVCVFPNPPFVSHIRDVLSHH